MNQRQAEPDIAVAKDHYNLDESLKSFWEKVQLAAQIIRRLREDRKILDVRVNELEQQVESLRSEVVTRDHELKRLRSEHAHLLNSNGDSGFTQEEKENIKAKIRDLISKINSYL